jgi:murein DD-endopeptidase MepM/ murein hydrolase activator NlpD
MNDNVTQTDSVTADGTSKARKTGSYLQQLGLNMLMVGLLALLAFLVWQRFTQKEDPTAYAVSPQMAKEQPSGGEAQPAGNDLAVDLQPLVVPDAYSQGILRQTNLNTIIPSRPRTDVITYTVQTGDTLFSIADNYGLKPETVLWGNFEVLNDNPHLLKPKQVLNILPVDGTYYQWHEGDTLSGVASFFKVDPQNIINYPGNALDLTQTTEGDAGIAPDTWIIIPGGKRAIKDWGPPAITRQNPASARYYGEGSCGSVYEGAYGTGTFVWPTTDHTISGYAYDPGVHPAIDIGGQEGNPIYATDSGVIVYAGWSDYGYGLLIVIDHGNGWQSAYAHLSAVAVTCGQSVYQGGYIGALGTTGNSSGPHLHFELVINGAKVNPLDYVQ